MKKICAMVLALLLLIGASEALADASSSSMLLSMAVKNTYEWCVPDAKIDCVVGVWGLWGNVTGTNLQLGDSYALQLSCYSQYGTKWETKLKEGYEFCMVHNNYTSTGKYKFDYKLSTTRGDEGDIAKNDVYKAEWTTVGRRTSTKNEAETYVIGTWDSDFEQDIYYKIDPAESVVLGTYRDYVTFFATVVSE